MLEARPDVLAYTTAPLDEHLEVVGPVQVELYARSSLEHPDFFACLGDVEALGKSINLSSAIFPRSSTPHRLASLIDLYRRRRGRKADCSSPNASRHLAVIPTLLRGYPVDSVGTYASADSSYHLPWQWLLKVANAPS